MQPPQRCDVSDLVNSVQSLFHQTSCLLNNQSDTQVCYDLNNCTPVLVNVLFLFFFGVKPYTEIRWYLPIAQCFYYTCITVRIRLVRPTVCLLIFCRVCRLKSILKNDFVLSDDLTWYCRLVECSIIGSGNSSQWRAGNWRTSSVQDKGQSCILWSKKTSLYI